jgi:hypothetical protein
MKSRDPDLLTASSFPIHVLAGAAALLAIALLFLLLRHGQQGLSPREWGILGGAALALSAAAFVPSLVGRLRDRPPPRPLSPADRNRLVVVTIIGCALASFGAYSGIWWLMSLGIMLAPLSFLPRKERGPEP